MSALPVTIFISLLLAGLFVFFFAREHKRRCFASAERDSLLPLADEVPHVASATETPSESSPEDCGCRDGSRPPCAGCRHHS